jgi:hypothetical protein
VTTSGKTGRLGGTPGRILDSFGNGLSAGPLNALFFTAGIEEERHGLFGALFPLANEQLLGNGK